MAVRIPAPGPAIIPAVRDHLSQAYRVIEQGINSAVQKGQDYEVGGSKIWLTAPDGSRYYITVFNDGTISTNGNPTPPAGTVTSVAATQPSAGFTITGSPITSSGTLVFSLANDLAALEALNSTGIAVRTAADTWAQRSIAAGAGVSVTDGGGVSGNPTIAAAVRGYIDGCQLSWNSTTSITIGTGTAYIEGLGRVMEITSAITLSSLSLSANTWYHVYVYDNAGTPAAEAVTTAPTVYNGTARSKTGDNTRRYVGSIRAGTGGAVLKFVHKWRRDEIIYQEDVSAAAFTVVSAGTATTATAVSVASLVPVTAKDVRVVVLNFGAAAAYVRLSNSNGPSATTGYTTFVGPGGVGDVLLPVNSSQEYTYAYDAAGNSSFHRVNGYVFER